MKYFKLPDLGEGLQEAEIVEWHVEAGDEVQTDQLVVSVETAKAIVDVPAPHSGKIERLFGNVGTTVHVGEALFEYSGGVEESGALVGTSSTQESADRTKTPKDQCAIEQKSSSTVLATPYIRTLANNNNIDLSTVSGTGPGGQISERDLVAGRNKTVGASPLKGARKSMVKNMTKAHTEVVKVTLNEDADIHLWNEQQSPTVRVVRAIKAACRIEPILNSWYDAESNSLQTFDHINLGVAVDTPQGLFVPVLRDVGKLSDEEIRFILNDAKQKAALQTLPTSAMVGATITLSNFGTLCGRYADPVVVPPCVAIIGTGKIRKEVVAVDSSTVAIRNIMPLSLSFDHRVITGGEAARFLKAFIDDLKQVE